LGEREGWIPRQTGGWKVVGYWGGREPIAVLIVSQSSKMNGLQIL